jgi:hypothetical protein
LQPIMIGVILRHQRRKALKLGSAVTLSLPKQQKHKDVLVLTHEIGSYTCPFADDRAHDGHQCCTACMQVLGHSMESARMAVSASYYDQTVPWYERLTVDCPLTGE